MAKADLVITLDIGEPRVGLWCETCTLPSAIEFGVHRIHSTGVSTMGTLRRCANGPHVEVEDVR